MRKIPRCKGAGQDTKPAGPLRDMGFETLSRHLGLKTRLLTRQLVATWLKWCRSAEKSSAVRAVHPDCDRTVIDQRHFHIRAKDAVLHDKAQLS